MSKIIRYNYLHWGPFLYKTSLEKEEKEKIKNVCSKESKDYRDNLAGLIKHEHKIDIKKFIEVLKKDKKNINSNIMCVLTKGIGNMFLEEIDIDSMSGYLTNYLIKEYF